MTPSSATDCRKGNGEIMSVDTGQIPFLIAVFFVLLFVNGAIVFAERPRPGSRDQRLEELVAGGTKPW